MKALALYKDFKKKSPGVSWPEGAEHTIFLDPDVAFAGNVTLFPGVIIQGTSWIGEGCILEPNCYVKASRIGKFCTLAGRIEKSVVGGHSQVRSNCRLIKSRCGTYCDIKGEIENSMLGRHVETYASCIMHDSSCGYHCQLGAHINRTQMGDRVNAKYGDINLLDGEIGNNVNFSAGTTFYNFDGTEKKKTFVGSGSFVGGKIIAPRYIGNNVYIVAGCTIREDIPDNTYVDPEGKFRPNLMQNDGNGHWVRTEK